jgi:hypothetical protein
MDKNLPYSVVIFSDSEKIQSFEYLESKEKLNIEFQNSKFRHLSSLLKSENLKESGYFLGQESTTYNLENKSPKAEPLQVEELGEFFVIKGSDSSLLDVIQKYAEDLRAAKDVLKSSKSSLEKDDKFSPETFLCNLIFKKPVDTENKNDSIVAKKKKQLYKAVLSPIIFNKKECVILQLEDISTWKNLEKEKKVSSIREKTIQ